MEWKSIKLIAGGLAGIVFITLLVGGVPAVEKSLAFIGVSISKTDPSATQSASPDPSVSVTPVVAVVTPVRVTATKVVSLPPTRGSDTNTGNQSQISNNKTPAPSSSPLPTTKASAQPATVTPTAAVSPTATPATSEPTVTAEAAPASGLININTADLAQLEKITGVGPTIGQRIIDYRQANGPFQTIEDIKNVKGIGDKTFAKMQTQITVGN